MAMTLADAGKAPNGGNAPKIPLLCDHEGCTAPAVGYFSVGLSPTTPGQSRGFDTVLRCQVHGGNGVMTKAVG